LKSINYLYKLKIKTMKKLSVLCGALLMIGATSNAQLIDEKNVTVTMDLQPILQLDMTTSDQLEFVFDDVSDYYAGIIKYGATQLRVSSSVDWDLYAIGRSNREDGFWDQQISYGLTGNGVDEIPISALELRQSQANPATGAAVNDYSTAFETYSTAVAPTQSNSVYYSNAAPFVAPAADFRYIAGNGGVGATTASVPGGSYMNQTGASSDYYYVMDYRILPGLPATFPMAFTSGTIAVPGVSEAVAGYAQPGVYSMYVQYVLLEDQ
jgi:hypothetical protein